MKKSPIRYAALIAVALMMSALASAMPAFRQYVEMKTADGQTVTVTLCGDEFGHWYSTKDGRVFTAGTDGLLRTSTPKLVNERRMKRMQAQSALTRRNGPKRTIGVGSSFTGSKKGLVILVNYTDVVMDAENTRDAFDDKFNKVGYNKRNHVGSVHDYFLDQSYGAFDLTFDVVGPYTLSQTQKYYGANDADGNDVLPATMIGEAVMLADPDVDYSKYDWDGDGWVDQVYVIYAGKNEADSRVANTIWPHAWELASAQYGFGDGPGALDLDGVTVNSYACSSELGLGSKMDGIGSVCHEYSHCLGLPDFYDTIDDHFGMDSWSLMDYGAYNGSGCVPAAYTAYERMFCGWLTPTELDSPTTITGMKPITEAPEAYIIYNDKNDDECYILQNIQKEGFNSSAYGHGLLVIHVDYDEDVWTNNEVNTIWSSDNDLYMYTKNTHERCTIIPADNSTGKESGYVSDDDELAGDPYPGLSGNTKLTDSSKPAATLYNANVSGKKLMSKPITEISEDAGLISFKFMDMPKEPQFCASRWQLVEDLGTVEAGTYALLSPDYYAFNGTITSGHGQSTAEPFVFDGDGYATTAPDGTVVLTLAASGSGYTMYADGFGYLYAANAKSGNLKWHTSESSYWYYDSGKSNWIYKSNSAYLRTYNNTFRTYGKNDNKDLLMARLVSASSTTLTLTVSAAGWATWMIPFDATLPTGMKAYRCTGVSGNVLTLSEVSSITANTPYIISAPAGSYPFTGVPTNTEGVYNDGLLRGFYYDEQAPTGCYVLQSQSGTTAFRHVTTIQPTVTCCHCILLAPVTSTDYELPDVTGIVLTESDDSDAIMYDLQGRVITGDVPQQGIVIRNGKKVLVR